MLFDYWPALAGLVATIAIELVVALLFRMRNGYELRAVALANSITNPPLVFAFVMLGLFGVIKASGLSANIAVAVIEIIAVAVEAWLYQYALRYSWRKAAVFSATANATSFLIGLLGLYVLSLF